MDYVKLFAFFQRLLFWSYGGDGFARLTTGTTGSGILKYDNPLVATFSLGETITGDTSGATAVVNNIVSSGSSTYLILTSVVGTFQNNEEIEGATSGATADVDGVIAAGTVGTFFILQADGAANSVLSFLVQQDGTISTAVTIVAGMQLKGTFSFVAHTSGITYAYTKTF
jgi:hypothetical protein